MDYANPTRLKIFGRAETRDPAEFPELHEKLADPHTDGPLEQLMVIRVEGLFWNCPKHITPRYSEAELAEALEPVRERLRMLAEEKAALRERLQERE
ncbi:hypothetical protein [Streptomyces sp. NPDC085596]|uniref:hypothetical protein n=1 Tax=Streptomyces sp. NPDC085596 TaxID=3365731 RepID=UPI0037D61D45